MKPKFSEIYYDPKTICWGNGNDIVGLKVIATIKLREKTQDEEEEDKADYKKVESIYNQYINIGQKFTSGGESSTGVIAKITGINAEKQYISWKQINTEELSKLHNFQYKPAKGKFNINAMISLIKTGKIILLNNNK